APFLEPLAECALADFLVAHLGHIGVRAGCQVITDAEEQHREKHQEYERQREPAGGLVPNRLQHASSPTCRKAAIVAGIPPSGHTRIRGMQDDASKPSFQPPWTRCAGQALPRRADSNDGARRSREAE